MGLLKKKPAPVTYTYNQKYLKDELKMTQDDLTAAYENLDNAIDPDLIDCCIYQLNSVQKRYKYLLRQAKQCEADIQ
jgi:hypothetical protein